jgi:hypothetical protein
MLHWRRSTSATAWLVEAEDWWWMKWSDWMIADKQGLDRRPSDGYVSFCLRNYPLLAVRLHVVSRRRLTRWAAHRHLVLARSGNVLWILCCSRRRFVGLV